MTLTLRNAIHEVQKLGTNHGFTLIVVGGGVVRLIGRKTAIVKADESKKIIILKHAENPDTRREEDAKTVIDIDAIAFSNASDPFTKEVKDEYERLVKDLKNLEKVSDFPAISVEPVLYHPYFPKPNTVTQFVSSIESYHDHDFFFRLGSVKKDIQKKSLDFWTIGFDDSNDSVVTFSPLALQKRYAIRGFSMKPKDREKILSSESPFAQFIANFRIKTKGSLDTTYAEWNQFEEQIGKSNQPSMHIKRILWNVYWRSIGTYLAHGTGLIGKLLLPLGNTFFAGK